MSEVIILAPNNQNESGLDNVFSLPPCQPFAGEMLSFIQSLSEYLLKSEECKIHSELVALGFWLRKSNIRQMQKSNTHQANVVQKALGTVLHFTPSNVDSMFVYSWVCSLLMGNNNIVRVASADSQAKLCLLSVINSLFTQSEFAAVAERNLFVSYPRESNLTAKLSVKASARVIWGGDESVQAIRAIQSHPRCRDISFADRYSACLINGDELNTDEKINELATKLWQDTEPHSQQACSSPKMVFWLGNTAQQKALFEHINQLASKKSIASNQLNNHLVTSQLIQSQEKSQQNIILKAICAIPINIFNESILEWHNGAGLFLVLQIKSVESLTNIVTDKLQTLSYWQIKKQEILKLVNSPSIQGIDRIVPVGQALDFNPDWDGYRLLTDLSRHITVG